MARRSGGGEAADLIGTASTATGPVPTETGDLATGEATIWLPDRDVPPVRLARTITVFTLSCFALIAVLNVLGQRPGPALTLACLACVVVVFGLQLAHSLFGARRWPTRLKVVTLSAQALSTYLPLLLFGRAWGGMAGCLGGAVLLIVPGLTAWVLFTLIGVSVLIPPLLLGMSVVDTAYLTVATVLTGLVIYGLSRLTELVAEVQATRGALTRMAVVQERLRFARDLHDLLGYSLSAISLKSELTYRLVHSRPERARDEVANILQISRQALSDVRTVASGYRTLSLDTELATVKSMLEAADVDADVDVSCGPLPPVVDTVLATTLREGFTNILRHSKVQRCSISAAREQDRIRLVLVNDGVSAQLATSLGSGGSGLTNLATRLDRIGGRLDAAVRDDGLFQLIAEAPLQPAQ